MCFISVPNYAMEQIACWLRVLVRRAGLRAQDQTARRDVFERGYDLVEIIGSI